MHQPRQRIAQRHGPAGDFAESRTVLRQHHRDPGFEGARGLRAIGDALCREHAEQYVYGLRFLQQRGAAVLRARFQLVVEAGG